MPHTPGWPATLAAGDVLLRPFRLRDAGAWSEVRLANEEWLAPWEPAYAVSWEDRHVPSAFPPLVRALRRQARTGATLPFAVFYQGRFAGQVTVGNVVRGSLNSGYLGYWVDGRVAGRGVCPTAVALVVDHCFGPVGLHRVEANIRPENVASRRVAEKLGFRCEGLHLRYLSIAGSYRDHHCYALTVEEVPDGLLRRWRARQAAAAGVADDAEV